MKITRTDVTAAAMAAIIATVILIAAGCALLTTDKTDGATLCRHDAYPLMVYDQDILPKDATHKYGGIVRYYECLNPMYHHYESHTNWYTHKVFLPNPLSNWKLSLSKPVK